MDLAGVSAGRSIGFQSWRIWGFSRRISHCSFLTCHGALRKVCSDRIIVGWRRPEGAVPFVMEATEHGAGSQLEGLLMANGDDEFGAGRRAGNPRTRGWMMLLMTMAAVLVAIVAAVVRWSAMLRRILADTNHYADQKRITPGVRDEPVGCLLHALPIY
jgi:hypothetical protein